MITDKLLTVSSAQALTATAASTDVIDLSVARDLGIGNDDPGLIFTVIVQTALVSAGSTTLDIALQSSTDNSTFTTLASSPNLAKAVLTTGATAWSVKLPPLAAGQSLGRYLRANYTVNVSNFTGGTIWAGIVLDRQANRAYAPGITISN